MGSQHILWDCTECVGGVIYIPLAQRGEDIKTKLDSQGLHNHMYSGLGVTPRLGVSPAGVTPLGGVSQLGVTPGGVSPDNDCAAFVSNYFSSWHAVP